MEQNNKIYPWDMSKISSNSLCFIEILISASNNEITTEAKEMDKSRGVVLFFNNIFALKRDKKYIFLNTDPHTF